MKKFRAVALMEPCLWWMDIAASGIPLQKLEVLISKISAGRPSQDTIRLCVFEAIPEDSRDTYGNRLWPAAVHLATYLTIGSKSSGPGQRVLQLGCGNGLCSLAAASLGCRVLATDYRQLPLDLLRQAAEACGVLVPERQVLDFAAPMPSTLVMSRTNRKDQDGDGVIFKTEPTATLADMKIVDQEVEEARDKYGDGIISKEDLDQTQEKVASEDPKPPVAETALHKDTDAKNSKEETEASHYQLVRGTLTSILSGAAKRFVETKSFEEVDKDGDGVITEEEITASPTEMQVESKDAEETKLQIISMADKDGDGVIAETELVEAKGSLAESDAESSDRCSRPFGGQPLEFLSITAAARRWLPCEVIDVRSDLAIKVNRKPDMWLTLEDQQLLIRISHAKGSFAEMPVRTPQGVPLRNKWVPRRKPKKMPQLDARPGPRKPRPHSCRRDRKAKEVPRGDFFPPPGKLAGISEGPTKLRPVELPCGHADAARATLNLLPPKLQPRLRSVKVTYLGSYYPAASFAVPAQVVVPPPTVKKSSMYSAAGKVPVAGCVRRAHY